MTEPPRRRASNEEQPPAPDGEASLRVVRDNTPVRYDPDAERALLAAVLFDPMLVWPQVDVLVRPEDFYVPNHAHIYAAMRTLMAAGTTAWAPQVVDQLRRDGLLETVGGRQAVEVLKFDYLGGAQAGAEDNARLVASYARSRRLLGWAQEMAEAAKRNDHPAALEVLRKASEEATSTEAAASWAPVDVGAALDGGIEPVLPTLLARSDGACLFYPAKTHAFNAEPEAGKSWLALVACVERMAAGEHVLYLDFEADVESVLERALALDADPGVLAERFHYVRPDDPFDLVARARLLELLGIHRPTLAVIDGVAEVMAMNAWDENANAEIAAFLNALPRLLEREGCAVVMIDHLVKDKSTQGRYARGGAHKLAGISGAAYRLEVVKPFARGHVGLARVIVTKDRHGRVRALCGTSPKVAEFELTSVLGEDAVRPALRAPDWTMPEPGGRTRRTGYMQRVSLALEGLEKPISLRALRRDVGGRAEWVDEAIEVLQADGYIAAEIHGRTRLHRSLRPYREADEIPTQGELDTDGTGPPDPEFEPF